MSTPGVGSQGQHVDEGALLETLVEREMARRAKCLGDSRLDGTNSLLPFSSGDPLGSGATGGREGTARANAGATR